ncbi:MAG: FHA domain-containing protein [Polyangiaceae bacterium]|jgi:ABC-type multidrug transport system ATPase subunit/pSer/pThr/pTyr-binding forkhead associated (FHA) protein
MSYALGKEQVAIGSAPDSDVVLVGAGVAPRHARIVRQGGQLAFVDLGTGVSAVNGVPLAANRPVPFDFRTQFSVGGVSVPLAHPAIVAMLASHGQVRPPPGQVIVGRDAARASLVLAHVAVSGHHATVRVDQRLVVDHGSTSGTWIAGKRLVANEARPFDPNGVIAFGPVPVPVSLLVEVGRDGARSSAAAEPAPAQGPTIGQPAIVGDVPIQPASAVEVASPRKHRTVIGELQLDALQTNAISVGRTPENRIVVNHPQVSARHAQIIKVGDQLFLEDRGSANGTYVRGQRLVPSQRVTIANGEKVFLGPMPLVIHIADRQVNVVVEDQSDWAGKPTYEIEAWDLSLEVPDRDDRSRAKVLLDHVSFKALPGDMIALMGPSGAGKTTLLLALNGYLPPSGGQVRINGQDLYTIYDALRGSIGYVPQDDIVHPELTVFEAVKYSARFRLPPDFSDEEIDRRVEETLRDLGLEGVRNLQIGRPEKKVLSGGQRKRVNIALELVTDPVILFLDEPTSGLAADDTTALISLLAGLTKKTGKTIVMTIHQPAKDEFEKFNLCFIMGYGGIPTYFGPTGDPAYSFFGSILERTPGGRSHRSIDNPRDMFDMLNVRERLTLEDLQARSPGVARATARVEAAKGWRNEYFQNDNPVFQRMFSGQRAIGTATAARGVPHRAGVAAVRQLGLLVSRYWRVRVRDRTGAAILFLQAPLIGLLLWFVFGGQKQAFPYWCLGALQELSTKNGMSASSSTSLLSAMRVTNDNTVAIFFVVVACIWFGTSNAAREIVCERSIYLRERMVNLRLFNYVLSKFILLGFFCIVQCALLLGIVFVALGFNGGWQAFLIELATLVALGMSATALGLWVSAQVGSAEAAMALTPIALIPQVVLGGVMVPMTTNAWLKPIMYVIPSRWGFEGAIAVERLAVRMSPAWNIDLQNPHLTSVPDFVQDGHFQCAIAQVASETLNGAWGFTEWGSVWLPSAVLWAMTLALLIGLTISLRRRDPV